VRLSWRASSWPSAWPSLARCASSTSRNAKRAAWSWDCGVGWCWSVLGLQD
jgi:hypothetical protein